MTNSAENSEECWISETRASVSGFGLGEPISRVSCEAHAWNSGRKRVAWYRLPVHVFYSDDWSRPFDQVRVRILMNRWYDSFAYIPLESLIISCACINIVYNKRASFWAVGFKSYGCKSPTLIISKINCELT